MDRKMLLSLFVVPTGHHEASWRLQDSPAELIYDINYYSSLAIHAERSGIHTLFFADAPALRTDIRHNTGGSILEPFTLLSALAMRTESIGLIGTASTTYNEPYNLARFLSSLDHISRGRSGWNIVTTAFDGAASNFGSQQHPSRADRYRRADEFVEVAMKLWDSWQEDAIIGDREAGAWADSAKVHPIDHAGEYFTVSGPFQSARSPQRYPVLVQAGASEPGRELAAKYAEIVFTVQRSRDAAILFRRDILRRARSYRRSGNSLRIMPGLSIYLASSRSEALNAAHELDLLVNPQYGLAQLRKISGIDLAEHPLDEPVSATLLRENQKAGRFASRLDEIVDIVERRRPTLRSLLQELGRARTHRVLIGDPREVALEMLNWWQSGACDGFNLMPPALPAGLEPITEMLLPELVRLGCWTPARNGSTLRDRLCLPPR